MLFEKFDEDKSGTMELDEMLTMFHSNKFYVSEENLEKIFKLVT
jgi:Ca2+-binding EF-hand superfamily protein